MSHAGALKRCPECGNVEAEQLGFPIFCGVCCKVGRAVQMVSEGNCAAAELAGAKLEPDRIWANQERFLDFVNVLTSAALVLDTVLGPVPADGTRLAGSKLRAELLRINLGCALDMARELAGLNPVDLDQVERKTHDQVSFALDLVRELGLPKKGRGQ